MTTGPADLGIEVSPAHPRPLDFSEQGKARVFEFNYRLKNKPLSGADNKTQLQLVRPFDIRRSPWISEEMDAFDDTCHAIDQLLKSDDSDKHALGELLYRHIANRVTRAISFINLATGENQNAKDYSSAHLYEDELKAQTLSPPILFDLDHLNNMADSFAQESETTETEIEYALPYKLNPTNTEPSQLLGKASFSKSGISAELSIPPLRRFCTELKSCPTSGFQLAYVAKCHELDPTKVSSLQLITQENDPIAAAIARAQLDLKYSPISIAASTVSPENSKQMAQLAIRGGFRDIMRDSRRMGLLEKMNSQSEPERGTAKSIDQITHTIAYGLLQNIQADFDSKGKYSSTLVESGSELTLKGEAGDAYMVRVVDGKLNINYQNPTLFKTNPGEYWEKAMGGINDIYRTLYKFYGLDTRTVKVEVPAKYKEVHLASLELVKPENCNGRMDWIGGYEKATMDKIIAAEQAVLMHFDSDNSRLDTAPNIIMDGATGSGKTYVSEALMASFAEKLGPKGVQTYRLTTTQQTTAQDIILDLRTWSRMKGKSVLLVEDLYQKIRLLEQKEAAAVLTTLNDVAKKIADSRDKVLILNTENLAETVKGGRAITEPHRFPHFIELKLDHTPEGIKDAFRAIVTKELSKHNSGIKKDSPEVATILQHFSQLTPESMQTLWEAILVLPDSNVLTPSLLNHVLSDMALPQRGNILTNVDGSFILELMPQAITDELKRMALESKGLGLDIKATVDLMWNALQPLVEAGKGDLRQGVEFILELMRRNQTDQQQLANILLGSRDSNDLFNADALTMLTEIAQGKTTVPPAEENTSI